MQHLLAFLILGTMTGCLTASEQPKHVLICRSDPHTTRIVTLQTTPHHQQQPSKQNPQSKSRRTQFALRQDPTKKYKRAFLQRSPAKIQRLTQVGCPQDTREQRQKAVLAILARTQDSTLKQQLFTAGLDAGSFTRKTAHRLGQAMQRQGRQLAILAEQTN